MSLIEQQLADARARLTDLEAQQASLTRKLAEQQQLVVALEAALPPAPPASDNDAAAPQPQAK